jgi:hypothetical protein
MSEQNNTQDLESQAIFIESIINEFMIYYNNSNSNFNLKNLFNGINIDDPTSTNMQMERLFTIKCEYEYYTKLHPEFNTPYTPDTWKDPNTEYELFGIRKNDTLYYVSPLLFVLLIEIVNLKQNDKKNKYNIVSIIQN